MIAEYEDQVNKHLVAQRVVVSVDKIGLRLAIRST